MSVRSVLRAALHGLTFLVLCAASALAQEPDGARAPQREHFGFNGGLAYTRTSLALDSAPARTRSGATLRLGVRVCLLCWANYSALSAAPGFALAFTDVRGIDRDPGVDTYGFSRLDVGAQLAWRIWCVRPYASVWAKNKRTAEVSRDRYNYFQDDAPTTWTYGIEWPFTKEGRGLDVNFTKLNGRFNQRERLDTVFAVPGVGSLGYRGWALSIGWSGPFTGSSLPWR